MTAAEFEQKWTTVPQGILKGAERFNVARVAHGLKDRLEQGHDPEYARQWVLEQPYYREDLASAFNFANGGADGLGRMQELLADFESIDAPQ
jgi:hypothetical protein